MGRHLMKWMMNRSAHEWVPLAHDSSMPVRRDQEFSHELVDVEIGVAKTFMHLYYVEVSRNYRNQGYGSKTIDRIVSYAQVNNLDVVLTASVALGADWGRLIQFYQRWGFREGHLERIPYRHNMYLQLHHQPDTQKHFPFFRRSRFLWSPIKQFLQAGGKRHG